MCAAALGPRPRGMERMELRLHGRNPEISPCERFWPMPECQGWDGSWTEGFGGHRATHSGFSGAALASVTRVLRDTSPWGPALGGAWGPTRGRDTHRTPPGAARQRRGPARTCSLVLQLPLRPPRPVPSRPPGAAPGRAAYLKRGRAAAAAPCAFPP